MHTLYGEKLNDNRTKAKKIISLGYKNPTYQVQIDHFNRDRKELHFSLYMKNLYGFVINKAALSDKRGIYALYEGEPSQANCLYVGMSEDDIRKRIYRYIKELLNISRDDETHPAAKKSRHYKINPHNIYVKFVLFEEFDFELNNTFIDEYIAPMLHARFNKKVKK